MARTRLSKQRLRTRALLLRRVTVGETDLIVHLFTEQAGSLSAMARGARKSTKRFAALEPMHLLRVSVDVSPVRELGTLTEALVERPRLRLATSLEPMRAAGRALRWLRAVAPARTVETELWVEVNALLDALDAPDSEGSERALVGAMGLRMLVAAGWGLELARCVRCGKPCPSRARTTVDVSAGGVVCRNCGGVGVQLSAAQRRALLAAIDGEASALRARRDADATVELVDLAFAVHGRGEAT